MFAADQLVEVDFKYTRHFWDKVLKIKNSDLCICLLCGNKYLCKPSNGKAVKSHMIQVHEYIEEATKINSIEAKESLFQFLTMDHISTTILDSRYFRKFLYNLNYTPPRRMDYNTYLATRSSEIICSLSAILSNIHPSLSMDGWKGDSNIRYIGISACYMDELFVQKTVTLGIIEVADEKSETLVETVKYVMDKYNIQNINSITTDNAPNVVKACNDLGFPHIRCLNHTIQLCINSAENEIVDKYKDNFIELSKQLRKVTNRNKIDLPVGTISTTRWNSTYLLMEQLFNGKDKLKEYFNKENDNYQALLNTYYSNKDLNIRHNIKPKREELLDFIPTSDAAYVILEKLVEVLKPLYTLTLVLEKREITLGMAYLRLKQLIHELKSDCECVNDYANQIKKELIKRLEILNSETSIPLVCCLLDVRVKPFIQNKELGFTDNEMKIATAKLIELYELYNNKSFDESCYNIVTTDLDKYLQGKKRRKVETVIKDEVQNYLMYDTQYSTATPIGDIWLVLRKMFPIIYSISKTVLSSLATSSESERMFSEAGRVCNLGKSRLSSEHLEQKLIISRNTNY